MQNAECRMQNKRSMSRLEELNCPRDCPRRSAVCHSACKQHDEYRAEAERLRRLRQQDNLTYHYQLSKKIHSKENRFG